MPRPARSSGDDRPTWADAAETAQDSRSRPQAPRFQAPVCLLHAGRARLPPQLRALEPARASPAKSQSLLQPARCLSNRDRNTPGANCKLDQWPVSITGKPDVERDVTSDASGPVPVSVRQGVVPARHGNTNLRANEAAFGWASVLE